MHLVESSVDFQIAGRAVPGFPIVLHEDMRSCTAANGFLRYYLMRGAIGSKKSWDPIGRAIYDYFSFLEAHELSWDDVDRGEEKNLVAAYRDYCFDEGLARNTIRQRVLYACEFYSYAQRQGWIQNLPYDLETRRVTHGGGYLAHVDARGGLESVRSVMPKAHKQLPKFLDKDQIKLFLGAADNTHHRMIARLALQSGLRREELATFPLAYVLNPRPGSGRNIRVYLDPNDGTGMKTKGSKARTIYLSRRLMQELHQYAVQRRGERATLCPTEQRPLFLNQDGKPFADDGKGIERQLSKIGKSVGIKVHPHMLRHTYATHTLVSLQRQPLGRARVEPLVFLQKQLGHASIKTTEIYLHIVNELADDAVLAYDDEVNEWSEEEGRK